MQGAVVKTGSPICIRSRSPHYGTEVEVNRGVKAGDQVILQPPVDLEDGDKARVIATPPTTAP